MEIDYPHNWPNLVENVLAALKEARKTEELYGAIVVVKSLVISP